MLASILLLHTAGPATLPTLCLKLLDVQGGLKGRRKSQAAHEGCLEPTLSPPAVQACAWRMQPTAAADRVQPSLALLSGSQDANQTPLGSDLSGDVS